MSRVLLVSRDVTWALQLAQRWAAAGPTQVVLLDGAVASARPGHVDAPAVTAASQAGAVIAVNEAAAARRAVTAADLLDGVKVVDLDEIADLVGDAAGEVVWL